MRQLLLPASLIACLLLAACAAPVGTVSPPQRIPPAGSLPGGVPPAPGTGTSASTVPSGTEPTHHPQPPRQLADGAQLPAVRGLVAAADAALAKGDVELAAVNLERAQRLAPQSAVVYQRLASVRLRQKRPAEAEQMARKALGYAGTATQQAALWQLIATARQMQGQAAQAQEARARAAALQSGTP